MKPKVAILIVTHNAARYIALTLKSCIQQTYENCSVYILDNASTDNTIEIVRGIENPNIHIFTSRENLGPYAGLNYLLDRTNGEEYVAIQDHDDLWLPTKIERQVDFLVANTQDVGCGTEVFYYYESTDMLYLRNNFAINKYVDHTSLMFRNLGFRYDPTRALPDEHFQARILHESGKMGCLPFGLTVHRIRNDQMNLSSKRNRLNFRGAWEHFRYTKGKDFSGTLAIIISALLPDWLKWWSRKKYSYKGSSSLTKRDFEQQHGMHI